MYIYSDKFWNRHFKYIGIAMAIAFVSSNLYEYFK